MDVQQFHIGDVVLQSGETLHDAWLSYATWGKLNEQGDNCILFPTYYTGTHLSNARIIGEQRALDPEKWFIVVPNLIGNGLSISPSNTLERYQGGGFPKVTVYDNVACQKLLLDKLGVSTLKLVLGWSMGAVQAWHWAVLYPHMVQNLLPVCGATRCWPYNQLFLKGVRAALEMDPTFAGGYYVEPPAKGLRAFGRVYMPWAYSAEFFREQRYKEIGFATQDDLLEDWELDHLSWDANNLLAKLWAWEHADVSAHEKFGGDLALALSQVTAKTIVMPCDHDQYFTLAENTIEAGFTRDAELRPIYSSAGHCAGSPGRFVEESAYIEAAIKELLSR
ncbi:alpha/beta fold hydrolase [Sulfuriferula nivalis]|uniref:Homoserine O-acetyltransferase n=1 Tax=Sulfuriferula nivalis TaxID=2675298 RepID=A0A809RGI6_9PROT|nr:alpha/beta fold hydrolase [Sulfuriferula nivalis]BBP00685.1 homoserine O-acetyltransferase [Sulfuriferula nivalis]